MEKNPKPPITINEVLSLVKPDWHELCDPIVDTLKNVYTQIEQVAPGRAAEGLAEVVCNSLYHFICEAGRTEADETYDAPNFELFDPILAELRFAREAWALAARRINNIKEFLNARGFEDAADWSRAFYRYHDCGPWVSFLFSTEPKDIYYEELRKVHRGQADWKNCTGIKIGSIVEGSDVCFGPETLLFPFTDRAYQAVIARMQAATNFYWIRDNSVWMCIELECGTEYILRDTQGELVWEGTPPPQSVRDAVENWLCELDEKEAEQDNNALETRIPLVPGPFDTQDPDWRPALVPNTEIKIWRWVNDLEHDEV